MGRRGARALHDGVHRRPPHSHGKRNHRDRQLRGVLPGLLLQQVLQRHHADPKKPAEFHQRCGVGGFLVQGETRRHEERIIRQLRRNTPTLLALLQPPKPPLTSPDSNSSTSIFMRLASLVTAFRLFRSEE